MISDFQSVLGRFCFVAVLKPSYKFVSYDRRRLNKELPEVEVYIGSAYAAGYKP